MSAFFFFCKCTMGDVVVGVTDIFVLMLSQVNCLMRS